MVRLPFWGKGGRRERDGPADRKADWRFVGWCVISLPIIGAVDCLGAVCLVTVLPTEQEREMGSAVKLFNDLG